MKSGWVDRDAAALRRARAQNPASTATWRCASIRPGCSAAIPSWCCTAAATRRSRPACATSSAMRPRFCASKAPAPTWRPSTAQASGGSACAAAKAARARRDRGRGSGCRRARQSGRAGRAQSLRRDHAARVPAAQIRRSHPCDGGAQHHRPAERRRAMRRGLCRPACIRALPHAGLWPRQEGHRGFRTRETERRPHSRKHGIVTFGDSAREAYERMIEMVSAAEDFIARHRKSVTRRAPKAADVARRSPRSRRSCAARAVRRMRKSKAPGGGSCSIFAAATPCELFCSSNDLAR